MQHFCTLNKRIMEAQRKTQAYATVLVDLVNCSIMTKAQAEELLGYSISGFLLNTNSTPADDSDDDSDDDSGNGHYERIPDGDDTNNG